MIVKIFYNLSETTSNDDSCCFRPPYEYTSKFSFRKGFNLNFLIEFFFAKHFSDLLSRNILAKILFLPPETDGTQICNSIDVGFLFVCSDIQETKVVAFSCSTVPEFSWFF